MDRDASCCAHRDSSGGFPGFTRHHRPPRFLPCSSQRTQRTHPRKGPAFGPVSTRFRVRFHGMVPVSRARLTLLPYMLAVDQLSKEKEGNWWKWLGLDPYPYLPPKKRYWYCELYAKKTTSNQYIYQNKVDSINQPRFLPSPFFDVFIVWDSSIGTVDYILHHLFCELYMQCKS